MLVIVRRKYVTIVGLILACVILILVLHGFLSASVLSRYTIKITEDETEKFIKWVDFNVPYSLLEKTLNLDIKSYGKEPKLN